MRIIRMVSDRFVVISVIIFAFLVIYISLFIDFFKQNSLWIFFLLIYIAVFFVTAQYYLRKKEFDEKLKIKKREDIRINFWN